MLGSIIRFYKANEWFRWLTFLPLVFGIQFIIIVILRLIDNEIMNGPFFRYFALPAISGVLAIILLRVFAPRWKSLVCWMYITILCVTVLYGIANSVMGWHAGGIRYIVSTAIVAVSAFVCNMLYMKNKKDV